MKLTRKQKLQGRSGSGIISITGRLIMIVFGLLGILGSTVRGAGISTNSFSLTTDTITSSSVSIIGSTQLSFDSNPWTEWSVRIYTQDACGIAGLRGETDPTQVLPVKVWCANYGPGTTPPDLTIPSNWNDYWLRIPDRSEMAPDSAATWRKLIDGTAAYTLSGLPVYIAADFSKGVLSGQDYSGTVYIDIINSTTSETGASQELTTFAIDLHVAIPLSVSITADLSGFSGFTDVYTTEFRKMATGTILVSLDASGLRNLDPALDYDAASLRVYTENNPSDPAVVQFGAKGVSNSEYNIPLKIWTPNYGLDADENNDSIPDIENDAEWKGGNAKWVYLLDKNSPVREDYYEPSYDPNNAWDHAIFDFTDIYKWSNYKDDFAVDENGDTGYVYHLPPAIRMKNPISTGEDKRIPVNLALVLDRKAGPQSYSTTVYVEFAVSADSGNTATTFTASVPVTFNLQDAEPIVLLTADTTTFTSFGSLPDFPGRVLAGGYLKFDFSAFGIYPYNAVSVRAYTDNSPSSPSVIRTGMMGDKDPSKCVPLKLWTPNNGNGIDGDSDGIPDISNNTNWRDNDLSVWTYINDKNDPVRENYYSAAVDPEGAWDHPLFDYTELYRWSDFNDQVDQYGEYSYHLPGNFTLTDRRVYDGTDWRIPVYIAADFTDAYPQAYATTVYFEVAFSADSGETAGRSVVFPVTVSAEVGGSTLTAIDWLKNRVDMRPDLDDSNATVEKLADSHQEAMDYSDGGWLYDQALAVLAFTRAGEYEYARQVLNALAYLQNSDGSWFFTYMTIADKDMVDAWATTDNLTYALVNDEVVISSGSNGRADEAEKRAFTDKIRGTQEDQISDWYFTDYTSTVCPQTLTTLPDRIKYRTYDFRKYTGSISWAALALIYYEQITGDDSYHENLTQAISWLDEQRETNPAKPGYGGLLMGRTWYYWNPANSYDGWVNMPSFSSEHNLDAYAVYSNYSLLAGDQAAAEKAVLIKQFMLNKLWAPHVDQDIYPEVSPWVNNCFFAGLDMYQDTVTGNVDVSYYLDAQSWTVLSLGGETQVTDKDGDPSTIASALDFLNETDPNNGSAVWTDYFGDPIYNKAYLKVTGKTFLEGTGFEVSGIDGYKEMARDTIYQTAENPAGEFVWSEGSEGVVAAYHNTGRETEATYYHSETNSYMLENGGVPYSTIAVPDSASYNQPLWSFSNNCSVAGTAWYLFNDVSPVFNPYQPLTDDTTLCFADFNVAVPQGGTGSDRTDEGGSSLTSVTFVSAANTGKVLKWNWTLDDGSLGYSYVYTYIFKDAGASAVQVPVSMYNYLKFWVKAEGAAIGRTMRINLANGSNRTSYYTEPLASGWNEIEIAISKDYITNIAFVFEGGSETVGPAEVYIDDIMFTKYHSLDGGDYPPDGGIAGFLLHLTDIPVDTIASPFNLSGAAASKMVLNYLGFATGSTPEQLQASVGAQSGEVLNGQLIEAVFDTINPLPYTYNYRIFTSKDQALAYLAKWVACDLSQYYTLGQGQKNRVPGLVPFGGNYTNWTVVNGVHASDDTFDGADILYGFWVTRHGKTGLTAGGESYLPVSEFRENYMITNGGWEMVVEPPADLKSSIRIPEFYREKSLRELHRTSGIEAAALYAVMNYPGLAVQSQVHNLFAGSSLDEHVSVLNTDNDQQYHIISVIKGGKYSGSVIIDDQDLNLLELNIYPRPLDRHILSREAAESSVLSLLEDNNSVLDSRLVFSREFSQGKDDPSWKIETTGGIYLVDQSGKIISLSDNGISLPVINLNIYPNPFNEELYISANLPSDGDVSIRVFDQSGRIVGLINRKNCSRGPLTINWSAGSLADGFYILEFSGNGFREYGRICLLR